jgi:hypothetical protein
VKEMDRQTFQNLVEDYLVGNLEGAELASFEEALAQNPSWRAELEDHRAIESLMRGTTVPSTPLGLRSKIMERVRAEKALAAVPSRVAEGIPSRSRSFAERFRELVLGRRAPVWVTVCLLAVGALAVVNHLSQTPPPVSGPQGATLASDAPKPVSAELAKALSTKRTSLAGTALKDRDVVKAEKVKSTIAADHDAQLARLGAGVSSGESVSSASALEGDEVARTDVTLDYKDGSAEKANRVSDALANVEVGFCTTSPTVLALNTSSDGKERAAQVTCNGNYIALRDAFTTQGVRQDALFSGAMYGMAPQRGVTVLSDRSTSPSVLSWQMAMNGPPAPSGRFVEHYYLYEPKQTSEARGDDWSTSWWDASAKGEEARHVEVLVVCVGSQKSTVESLGRTTGCSTECGAEAMQEGLVATDDAANQLAFGAEDAEQAESEGSDKPRLTANMGKKGLEVRKLAVRNVKRKLTEESTARYERVGKAATGTDSETLLRRQLASGGYGKKAALPELRSVPPARGPSAPVAPSKEVAPEAVPEEVALVAAEPPVTPGVVDKASGTSVAEVQKTLQKSENKRVWRRVGAPQVLAQAEELLRARGVQVTRELLRDESRLSSLGNERDAAAESRQQGAMGIPAPRKKVGSLLCRVRNHDMEWVLAELGQIGIRPETTPAATHVSMEGRREAGGRFGDDSALESAPASGLAETSATVVGQKAHFVTKKLAETADLCTSGTLPQVLEFRIDFYEAP